MRNNFRLIDKNLILNRGYIMHLFERLQKAIDKGYIPVHITSDCRFFFIENNREFKVGDIVSDSLGYEYKVTHVNDKQLSVIEC